MVAATKAATALTRRSEFALNSNGVEYLRGHWAPRPVASGPRRGGKPYVI